MFTIICCSVRPERVAKLSENIAQTIGDVEYQMIAFDNREVGDGICRIYNKCAEQARYPYLCFVHEDVEFLTPNWGRMIAEKLREESCGVVGFAGSIIKTYCPIGWRLGRRDTRSHYVQFMRGKFHKKHSESSSKEDYSQVVTLDGMCLFVRREVWAEHRFDEVLLDGFHGYDIDFTLSVAQSHKNWVCNLVDIVHYSEGAYSAAWLETMQQLCDKWRKHLPIVAYPMSEAELRRFQQDSDYAYIRFMWQKGFFDKRSFCDGLRHIVRYPTRGSSWVLPFKYLSYRLRAARRKSK